MENKIDSIINKMVDPEISEIERLKFSHDYIAELTRDKSFNANRLEFVKELLLKAKSKAGELKNDIRLPIDAHDLAEELHTLITRMYEISVLSTKTLESNPQMFEDLKK